MFQRAKVYLNKPEYFYRPLRILKRVQYYFNRHQEKYETLPWGHQLKIDTATVIGRSIATFGLYDLCVCEATFRILSAGDTCLDVGANIGAITSAMSYRVSSKGKVHAFEPEPTNYQKLNHNVSLWFKLKVLQNVVTYPKALSKTKGEMKLYRPKDFLGNPGIATLNYKEGAEPVTVEVTTLSELFSNEKIHLLKMDVEGHELSVLEGAEPLLKNKKIQNIIFEDHDIEQSQVLKFLEKYGYEIFRLNKTFNGVILSDPFDRKYELAYEAPNFVATLDPEQLSKKFAPQGYYCLKRP